MTNPFEKEQRPEIKFNIPLEGMNFEFSTESIAFNPDWTSATSIQESLMELRQIRLYLIRGLNIVKQKHAQNKRAYNVWLAQTRSSLRPEGKSFKNLDEAQDAIYLFDPTLVMEYESKIEKSRAIRDELQNLLEAIKDIMFGYTKTLDILSR